jgi:hypothetical protein
MAENFYTLLTDIGKAQLANSSVLGTKVNFKTLKVGDGNGSYYNPIESQTDLIHTVWQGNINSVSTDENNPNWIVIEVMVPSDVGGFTIREYGAFDDKGQMLAICKCAETYKPVITDGSTKELLIRMILSVSNIENIDLKIDPTIIFAKKSEVEQLRTDVNAAIAGINSSLSELTNDRIYYCGTTSGTNTYAVTNSEITAYTDGLTVRVKIGNASTGASTLNINGLGAKPILDTLGNPITSGGLKAGLPYQLCYNGTNFIVLGKGGGGDATTAQVLINKKVTVDSGQIVGTMPDNGAVTIIPGTTSKTIPLGYHNGSGIVAGDADLIGANIRKGINLFNVDGTYDPLTLIAGTNSIIYQSTSVVSGVYTSYTSFKSATNKNFGGRVTVSFGISSSNSAAQSYARIYVNGYPVGTQRFGFPTMGITYTEDITINIGDIIQIYAYSDNLTTLYVSNFKISCGNNYGTFI